MLMKCKGKSTICSMNKYVIINANVLQFFNANFNGNYIKKMKIGKGEKEYKN